MFLHRVARLRQTVRPSHITPNIMIGRQLLTVALSLGLLSAVLATQEACTLGSDTIVYADAPVNSAKDSGPSSSSSSSTGGSSSGEDPKSCGGDDWAKPDLGKLKACGGGKGHCYAKAKTTFGEGFAACEGSTTDVCVPDEILKAGGSKLKSCTARLNATSQIGPGGCVTASLIPDVAAQGGSALKPDVCEPHQICLPCTDPTKNNAPTPFCQPIGVHEKECGAAPAGGAAGGDAGAAGGESPGCCVTGGKANGMCLPTSTLPEDERESTPKDVCAGDTKCAPRSLAMMQPVKCDAGFLGGGICLDKCFNNMMSLAQKVGFLSSEGCGTTEICVPCLAMKNRSVKVPGCE
jgi:hypothetical protein